MWKTFIISPLAGGIAALLGWVAAIAFKNSMSDAEFADLRFGWEGALVGAIAISCVIMLLMASDMAEPMVVVATAALTSAVVWNTQELPFATRNLTDGAANGYWFTVTMMILVFILLLMGLRAARESNNRARG